MQHLKEPNPINKMKVNLLKGERTGFAFLHGSLFLSSRKLQRILARLAPRSPEMCSSSGGIGGWKYQGGVISFELCALSLVWSGIDSANEGCTVCSWHQSAGLSVLLLQGLWQWDWLCVCWDVGSDPTPVSQHHWSLQLWRAAWLLSISSFTRILSWNTKTS